MSHVLGTSGSHSPHPDFLCSYRAQLCTLCTSLLCAALRPDLQRNPGPRSDKDIAYQAGPIPSHPTASSQNWGSPLEISLMASRTWWTASVKQQQSQTSGVPRAAPPPFSSSLCGLTIRQKQLPGVAHSSSPAIRKELLISKERAQRGLSRMLRVVFSKEASTQESIH